MKLKLAAEIFEKCYGITILDDDFQVDINESEISSEILVKLKKWYSEYYQYTGMSHVELKSHASEIEVLDNRGKDLLNDIYKSRIFNDINEFTYYSRGKDEVLLKLDSNGRPYKL